MVENIQAESPEPVIQVQNLADSVQIISWLLPATYGTWLLQELMLRGLSITVPVLLGLIGYGLLLFLFARWRLRRKMGSE